METFYGIQLCQLTPNRFYKCYIGSAELFGARIAGQWFDEAVAVREMSGGYPFVGLLFSPWIRKAIAKRDAREAEYDAMAPDFHQFLQKDKHNFQIPKRDLENIFIKEKKHSIGVGIPTSGVLHIQSRSKKPIKLILPEYVNAEAIMTTLGGYL